MHFIIIYWSGGASAAAARGGLSDEPLGFEIRLFSQMRSGRSPFRQ